MTSTGVRASGAENFELPSGHSFDPQSGPKPRVYLDGIWGIYLRPAPGGQTRLVAHTRGRTSRRVEARHATVIRADRTLMSLRHLERCTPE